MRGHKKSSGKDKKSVERSKKLGRSIVAAAGAVPLAVVAPVVSTYAVPIPDIVVTQPLSVAVFELIETVLGGDFQIGESITVDLDEIFENDVADLELTIINHNPSVAVVSLLSGDLYIGGKNAGSTIVELTARTSPYSPSVHERFELSVTASGIVDGPEEDGVTIDDIVRYMQANPSRSFSSEELSYLLGQIKPIAPSVNHAPISTGDDYNMYVKKNEEVTIDLRGLFYDEDELTYEVQVLSSGSTVHTAIASGSLLSLSTPESASEYPIQLLVTGSDHHARNAEATKWINLYVQNTIPTVANPIVDTSISQGELLNFTIPSDTFEDADGMYGWSYTATLAGGAALPGWLGFDESTGTFIGVPEYGNVGEITVTVTFIDRFGASVSDDFTINVENVNDPPIGDTTPGVYDRVAMVGQAFNYEIPESIFYDPDGDEYTLLLVRTGITEYEGDLPPDWFSFDSETRTITGIPTVEDIGDNIMLIEARDIYDAYNFIVFTITVE